MMMRNAIFLIFSFLFVTVHGAEKKDLVKIEDLDWDETHQQR